MLETSDEYLQFDWPFETEAIRSCQKYVKKLSKTNHYKTFLGGNSRVCSAVR